MKNLFRFCMLLFLFTGCYPNLIDNQYLEKTTFEDAMAPYVGEWTAAMPGALTAIKINGKGDIKICSSNPYFGSGNGKIFKKNGKIYMIFEDGTQMEILSAQKDYIVTVVVDKDGKVWGPEYKNYSGKVPENCRETFKIFSERAGKSD